MEEDDHSGISRGTLPEIPEYQEGTPVGCSVAEYMQPPGSGIQ